MLIKKTNKSGRDLLLDQLPEESFGGGVKHLPRYHCSDTVFVKGICTSVSIQEFSSILKDSGIQVIEVKQLSNRLSGKPMRVVKVRCLHEFTSLLLERKIVVRNSV